MLDLRDFITTQLAIECNIDWQYIEDYIGAFKGAYDATLKLQQEQLVYSDFYKLWLELRLQCEQSSNHLAQILLKFLKIREIKLLENESLLAAIYMDPRINLILTDEQKMLAKQNLKKISYRIFEITQVRQNN